MLILMKAKKTVLWKSMLLLISQRCVYIYIYNESTEPIDAVNILPLERFEPTTMTTPPLHYYSYRRYQLRH